ncbi:LIPK Lipase, partial [Mionectes macconnelli]|nr:LIPK Lipase [Mionectes macconnelli]
SEMVSFFFFPSEEYNVVTEDGYILHLFFFPHGRGNAGCQGPRPVTFFFFGLLAEGSFWVTNLVNNSLGFILADAGYDVWIGNSRGIFFFKRHLLLSPKREDFWAFSFDEMAKYDLPAMVNFIEQKTGQKQLYYIGHFFFFTVAFVAFSTMPQLAFFFLMFLALAPVTTVTFSRSPVRKLALFSDYGLKEIFGTKDFLPHTALGELFLSRFCACSKSCQSFLATMFGFNWKNTNMSLFFFYAGHIPAGTSVQNVIHWMQVNLPSCFPVQNRVFCRQSGPPLYDVKDMEVPTAIWNGGLDCLADPQDTALLLPQIKNLVHHRLIPHWNHMDFILGLDAAEILFFFLLDTMKKHP